MESKKQPDDVAAEAKLPLQGDGSASRSSRRANRKSETEDAVIEALRSLVPALAAFYGRFCEVVVHDLRVPERSIVAIANNHVTGRKLNGPLVGGPFGDVALKWLREPGAGPKTQVYETKTRDGKTLKSATTLFRNELGEPFAALCLNQDTRAAESALNFLTELLRPNGDRVPSLPDEIGNAPDVDEILEQMIAEALAAFGSSRLNKDERTALVRDLDDKGAFLVRGAVRKLSEALGVSKFTIYGDLDRVRAG